MYGSNNETRMQVLPGCQSRGAKGNFGHFRSLQQHTMVAFDVQSMTSY